MSKLLRSAAVSELIKELGIRISGKSRLALDRAMQKETKQFLKCAAFLTRQQKRQTIFEQDLEAAKEIWRMTAVPEYLQGLESELKNWLEAKRQKLESKQSFLEGEHYATATLVEKDS